jgi:soluble lytic murein transglycosylase-like protein
MIKIGLIASLLVFSNVSVASNEYQDCFKSAGKKYKIDYRLLRAIASVESEFNPKAINKNADSIDIGIMQINSSWLPKLNRFGVQQNDLFDACTNIQVGSWVLADNISRLGSTWNAVGAYNAKSPDKRKIYVARVIAAYRKELGYYPTVSSKMRII